MQIIGFQKSKFTPKGESTEIVGYNLYLAEDRENVTGRACERIFLTDKKLNGYVPALNDKIAIVYNKFGKVEEIRKQ